MTLLSRLFIPVIAGLSLITTTVSCTREGFTYNVGNFVTYISYDNGSPTTMDGEVVEVGSCNEEVKKIEPDSNCNETHWYKLRIVKIGAAYTKNGQNNVYTVNTKTNRYEYVNQKNIQSSYKIENNE